MLYFRSPYLSLPGRYAVISLLAASLSLFSAMANAQDSTEEAVTPVQPPVSITREQLMTVIASEIVLAPGIGLRHIRLGEELDAVRNRLGPPREIETEGLVRETTILTYTLDSGTNVLLSGDKWVESISVSGNSASLVRTVKGARFGMSSSLIQRIYREPSKARDDRLEYRHLGVTFYFDQDQLNRIRVYQKRA